MPKVKLQCKLLTGSRRPSLASIHSTTSSAKSYGYSARRFERERNEKEQRQALAELKLKQQQQQQELALTTPSPRSPKSTDGLLPNSATKIKDIPSIEVNFKFIQSLFRKIFTLTITVLRSWDNISV